MVRKGESIISFFSKKNMGVYNGHSETETKINVWYIDIFVLSFKYEKTDLHQCI